MMNEVDKILHNLGYLDADPQKREEFQGYIKAAEAFMTESGVPEENLKKPTALTIKTIWADHSSRGEYDKIIKKDNMIVALLSQLKR